MASNLNITELDFDQIKTNLKNYLSTTSEFRDYDFEGSNLSTLIDLLAYNTYYNGYYLNMVSNEMFLDSAVLRESILSRAKELNYVPRSAVAAKAKVNLSIAFPTSPATVTVPKFTSFTTDVDGQTYTFSTLQAYVAIPTGGNYVVNNVEICEGEVLSFTYNAYDPEQPPRFVIPNDNVDINNLVVTVQNSASDTTTTTYTKADTLFNLSATSTVYFVQPMTGNQYELVFGDGVSGKKLLSGNIVKVQYLATDGTNANKASTFTYNAGITGATSVAVTTAQNSAGGAFEESMDSIRFNAPRHYSAQYRAVTANDFKTLIEQEFPNFKSVRAYGGEELSPPQYGKVLIAIRPATGETIGDVDRENVLSFLKSRSVLSVRPEIADPNYIYLGLNYLVKYDPDKTSRTSAELSSLIESEIVRFGDVNLGAFNATLRASKLAAQIDALDTAILGSGGSLTVNKRLFPTLNSDFSVKIEYNNKIRPGDPAHERHSGHIPVVFSTGFTYAGQSSFLKDDGSGVLYVFTINNDGTEKIINENVGTVDYTNGIVNINKLNISDYDNNYLVIKMIPEAFDIVPSTNQILLIDSADLTVTSTPEIAVNV